MEFIITIFSLAILLFSVIIHELAHGYVAYSLGDPTAKYQGRLTLNPIKHLDLFGSIILPLLLFFAGSPMLLGWAKPVPVNPYNFTDQKWGALKVSLAGPLTNIALALLFGIIIRFTPLSFFVVVPGLLIIFSFIVHINIILALFNLVPIPPLDGHWVLFKFIPSQYDYVRDFLSQYGIFILLFLLFAGGLQFLGTLAQIFFSAITGI